MKKITSLFATPARAVLSSLCLILLLILLGAGIFLTAGFFAKRSAIGTEQAKAFAFADAGADPSSVRAVYTEFEFEDGHFVYKVEFLADNIEYEYLVKASNGKILEREIDVLDQTVSRPFAESAPAPAKDPVSAPSAASDPAAQTEPAASVPTAQTEPAASDPVAQTRQGTPDAEASGQIDLENAKKTALTDAGLMDSDITYEKTGLDNDDHIQVYKIEFYTAAHEYEYEIDAVSGEIRHKKQEVRQDTLNGHYTSPKGSSAESSGISLEAAQSIAADHAGLSSSDIVFTKTKQDHEKGRTVYELEFFKDRMEYEYEIDAVSGEILKFEYDYNG